MDTDSLIQNAELEMVRAHAHMTIIEREVVVIPNKVVKVSSIISIELAELW